MTFGEGIVNRYMKLGGNLPHVHARLLHAKSAAIHSTIPHQLKTKMVHGYRSAEKNIFGKVTTLPGEEELGVGGLGTTLGQRIQLRKAAMSAANPPADTTNAGQSDITQALLSKYE
jgi:hypothetical protein